jgi:uncharacterized protein (DUF1015 family)
VRTLPGHISGLALKPFRGIRYAPDRVRDIARVTSPPYDVISSGTIGDLLSADPYNVVRLILSAGGPAAAAATLGEWLRSGVLAKDVTPSIYIYEQKIISPNAPSYLQRGIVTLVRVGAPPASGIFPHEAVMPGPVEDRRDLMLATRANLEPIFLVYNGGVRVPDGAVGVSNGVTDAGVADAGVAGGAGGTASGLVDFIAETREPMLVTVTPDGLAHRLWRVTDPALLSAVAADLGSRTALIADGHHRYAAYEQMRSAMHDAGHGDGPWDYGLAFLVDADSYPPRIGAIHRVLPGLSAETAVRLASAAFEVTALRPPGPADDLEGALELLARGGEHAFLLAGRAGFWLLSAPSPARVRAVMPPGTSRRWRSLDAAVLQELLLADLWGIKDNERDVVVSHDAADAVRMARESGGTAVLCNPVPFEAIRDIAADGECVPRKSTSFGPKPRSGLLLRTFDD